MFLLNAPLFAEATIAVSGGDFSIRTTNFTEPVAGGPVQYVQSMTLNGMPLVRTWLTGPEVHSGGELVVDLGPDPSDWGTTDLPPSESTEIRPFTALTNPGVKL